MNAHRLLEHFERISDSADAVPRLRRFVLNLAVRGKLLPSSSVSALMTSAESIACDEPFPVPRSWRWVPLAAICSKTGSGSTPRGGKNAYKSFGIPFLRSQNVYDDGLRLDDVAYIDNATHEKMAGTAVYPGDLLLNITGGSMGRCARVPDNYRNANVSQHVAIIRVRDPGTQDYLHKCILSPFFQALVFGEQTGAGRGGLPKNKMDRLPIPLPPPAEQHRIVAKADELMALCDRLEAAQTEREARRDRLVSASLARVTEADRDDATSTTTSARFHLDHFARLTMRPEHVKQLRQTILGLAVQGRLVPQDPAEKPHAAHSTADVSNDPDMRLDLMLPTGWQWARVRDVAEARLGKMLDKAKNNGRQYKYLRNTNVHWFEVRTDEVKTMPLADDEVASFLLKEGDVLICEGGHGIARTAVWRGEIANMAFQKALHRVRPGKSLHGDFFAFCINVYFQANVLQRLFTGVGIPHFTGVALSKLVFPLPPFAEQQRIVAKVDELMGLYDQLEASLASAAIDRARLLEALLHAALEPAA